MTDRSKQIIPDSQAVAHFVDPEILEILDSHGTFTISELLKKMTKPIDPILARKKIDAVFVKFRSSGEYSKENYLNDVKNALASQDPNSVTIFSALVDGTSCKLLQPDGKGWQKGTLKLYCEFIPEETDSVVTQYKLVETHQSSLDAIRELANE